MNFVSGVQAEIKLIGLKHVLGGCCGFFSVHFFSFWFLKTWILLCVCMIFLLFNRQSPVVGLDEMK